MVTGPVLRLGHSDLQKFIKILRANEKWKKKWPRDLLFYRWEDL